MLKENWKDIKGYEGLYQISNFGRVLNIKRNKIKAIGYERYAKTILCKYNIKTNISIHKLVAEAFIDNPNDYKVVMHLDNNTYNNNVSNLKWGTQSMNIQQSIQEGRFRKSY
jgi:hypothetical protein